MPEPSNLSVTQAPLTAAATNPLLALPFEPAIEGLGPDCWDVADAASFPCTTLRFRNDNPFLGDGRGFLYGQLRDRHGQLQDLGTKGSGTTPWSRGGDGRLTLKGGLREVIGSEALHRLGVTTSRTLCLIETGEELYRGDEPSPPEVP